MKCTVNGQNAAILAKAIHSFARIGNELYMEADESAGLLLRTVNMTKSAFSLIRFNLDFFSSFTVKSKNVDENQCKLSMKSCLGVFRNMKQVESCSIALDTKSYKLNVQFRCRLETIRTHHISILELESLQATYLKDRSLNIIGGNHKLFSNIVSSFKTNEEELSITVTEKNVVIQNYVQGTHIENNFVRSQITLQPDEFEIFKIGESTTITFCMRELRAILNFAESMNTSISANFDRAGKPVVFVIRNFDTFEANLVMSTLSPEDLDDNCQRSRSLVQISSQNTHLNIERTNGDCDREPMCDDESNGSNSSTRKRNCPSENGTDFEFGISRHTALDVLRKRRRTSSEGRRDTRLPSGNDANPSEQMEQEPPALIQLESESIDVVFQDDSPRDDLFGNNGSISHSEMSEPIENQANNVRDHRCKKMQQVFSRCFTGNTPKERTFGQILAEASDEEQ